MKQFLVMIGLLLCLSSWSGQANAGTEPKSAYVQTLEKVAGSVLQVTTSDYMILPEPPFEATRKLGTGTGFVVLQNKEKTVILTAKHVVNMSEYVDGRLKYTVNWQGTDYTALLCEMASDMDAAYLEFRPSIPGLKALQFNLSPSTEVIEALAFGFGQANHIKGQPQKYTFTHGYVSRKVGGELCLGDENTYVTNFIYGTPTLIFGYSGGPLLDTNFKIIGINVAMMGQANMFVDSRGVWNWMKLTLGRTNNVHVPVDPSFDVFNRPGKSRIAIKNKAADSIESEWGKMTLAQLAEIMTIQANKELRRVGPFIARTALDETAYKWVAFGTLVTIGDKHYRIRRVMLTATPVVPYRYENPLAGDDSRYIYMCGREGWEVIIGLVEINSKQTEEFRGLHKALIKQRKVEEEAKAAKEKEELEAKKQAAAKRGLEKAKQSNK